MTFGDNSFINEAAGIEPTFATEADRFFADLWETVQWMEVTTTALISEFVKAPMVMVMSSVPLRLNRPQQIDFLTKE